MSLLYVIIETALPIGEYAAVTLLIFFGLKSIKDAWNIPSNVDKSREKSSPELDEYAEAEELVKEKVISYIRCLLPRDPSLDIQFSLGYSLIYLSACLS